MNDTPAVWLGLACLLPLAMTGCQTTMHPKANPSALGAALGGKPEEQGAGTQFQSKVAANQEVNVHIDLARALEAQGNYESAVMECQKAISVAEGPGTRHGEAKVTKAQVALAHRRMAGALDHMGKFAQAEVHYREALKASPNDVNVWNDAGYSYYLQKRWAASERCLLTAAKLDPNNSRVQTNLGLALAASGKTDAALAALSKAGGPAVAHANLGYLLAATGKTEQAREHYQAALDIQPQFEAARFALSQLDTTEARQLASNSPAAPGLQPVPNPAGTQFTTMSVASPLPSPASPAPGMPASPAVAPAASSASASQPAPSPWAASMAMPGATPMPTPAVAAPTMAADPAVEPPTMNVRNPVLASSLPAGAAPTLAPAVMPPPLEMPQAHTSTPVVADSGAYPGATTQPATIQGMPSAPMLRRSSPEGSDTSGQPQTALPLRVISPSASRTESPAGRPALTPVVQAPWPASTSPSTILPRPHAQSSSADEPKTLTLTSLAAPKPAALTAPETPRPLVAPRDPSMASADAGIPLPSARAIARMNPSDRDLSRASADTGIPLPKTSTRPATNSLMP